MLAKTNRLTEKRFYDEIREKGDSKHFSNFIISYLKRSDKNPTKFGFIVSNKISKNATLRNRAKRAMRESVRISLSEVKNGYDIVYISKLPILKASTSEIMNEVKKSLLKTGISKLA